jgi:hypothetical protein
VRLALPPSASQLSRRCGILNILLSVGLHRDSCFISKFRKYVWPHLTSYGFSAPPFLIDDDDDDDDDRRRRLG